MKLKPNVDLKQSEPQTLTESNCFNIAPSIYDHNKQKQSRFLGSVLSSVTISPKEASKSYINAKAKEKRQR